MVYGRLLPEFASLISLANLFGLCLEIVVEPFEGLGNRQAHRLRLYSADHARAALPKFLVALRQGVIDREPSMRHMYSRICTREQAALVSGLSLATVASAEGGASLPKVDTLCRLTAALGYRLGFLFRTRRESA
jgi:transcriptional regulator with XRE-family HTH domain